MRVAEASAESASPGRTARVLPPELAGRESSAGAEAARTSQDTRAGGRGKALSGAVWTIGGFGLTQVLRFAFNLIMTRLLLPEAFGLMALVNALVLGLQLFSEMGIGPSIIQHKSGEDERFLNTAWTLQAVRGLGVWFVSALLAWPLAAFYETPLLIWLIPACGANAALAGFNSTSLHVLTRRLVRVPQVLLNVGGYLLGILVTIAWVSWVHADVWGFVVGSLVNSLAVAVASHCLLPGHRNRLCWDRRVLRELLHFGKWIFFGTVCTFLADQADRLVLGKVVSFETLGCYQIALQLSWMPVALLSAVVMQVVFPVYSRSHQTGEGVAARIVKVHPLVVSLGALMATGLFVTGPTLIGCLYGARYEPAEWMVQFLAVGALLKMLEGAASAILLASGQSAGPAVSSAMKILATVILMPCGYYWYGLPGLLGALVLADLTRYATTLWAVRRRGVHVLRYDLAVLLCCAVITVAATCASRQAWLPANDWVKAGVAGGVVVALWAGVLLAANPCLGRLAARAR